MYGGGPQNHYVFRGEAQRRRRTRNLTIALTIVLALLLAWCVYLFYTEMSRPAIASADSAVVQVDTAASQAGADEAPAVQQAV